MSDLIKAILIDARMAITEWDAWCQNSYTIIDTPDGRRPAAEPHAGSPNACAWCVSGALHRAAARSIGHETHSPRVQSLVDDACREITATCGISAADLTIITRHPHERAVTRWNDDDDRTHAEVLDALDQTIERLTTD